MGGHWEYPKNNWISKLNFRIPFKARQLMNFMDKKVLVGAPVYNGMKYCLNQFIESIKNFSYKNYEILLVDNSDGDELFEELKKRGINVIKDRNPEKIKVRRVVSSRNIILSYALENGFDYILMMDSDVVAPSNILEELLSCNKDIVSGLYSAYFALDGKTKLLPVAWALLTEDEFNEVKENYNLPEHIKSRFDMPRHITKEEADSNSLIEVFMPSAGCMLMSRNVFEKVKYNSIEEKDGSTKKGDDLCFIDNARESGFEAFCFTKIKCEHLLKGKYSTDEEGNLVHPWAK